RLDVHGALALIDRFYGAGNGGGLCRKRSLLRPAGQGNPQDQRRRGQHRCSSLHVPSPYGRSPWSCPTAPAATALFDDADGLRLLNLRRIVGQGSSVTVPLRTVRAA